MILEADWVSDSRAARVRDPATERIKESGVERARDSEAERVKDSAVAMTTSAGPAMEVEMEGGSEAAWDWASAQRHTDRCSADKYMFRGDRSCYP